MMMSINNYNNKSNNHNNNSKSNNSNTKEIPTNNNSSEMESSFTNTYNNKKKISAVSVIRELERLKSQQKYLECNQTDLLPSNFIPNNEMTNCETETLRKMIDEIILKKGALEAAYKNDCQLSEAAIKKILWLIKDLKADIFQPERLRALSVQTISKRILSVEEQLERVSFKNACELNRLQMECTYLTKL